MYIACIFKHRGQHENKPKAQYREPYPLQQPQQLQFTCASVLDPGLQGRVGKYSERRVGGALRVRWVVLFHTLSVEVELYVSTYVFVWKQVILCDVVKFDETS